MLCHAVHPRGAWTGGRLGIAGLGMQRRSGIVSDTMWIDTHCHLDASEFGAGHALALDLRARLQLPPPAYDPAVARARSQ